MCHRPKQSTVAAVANKLQEYGAMDYSIVVAATASEPAPLLYMAPYSGGHRRRIHETIKLMCL